MLTLSNLFFGVPGSQRFLILPRKPSLYFFNFIPSASYVGLALHAATPPPLNALHFKQSACSISRRVAVTTFVCISPWRTRGNEAGQTMACWRREIFNVLHLLCEWKKKFRWMSLTVVWALEGRVHTHNYTHACTQKSLWRTEDLVPFFKISFVLSPSVLVSGYRFYRLIEYIKMVTHTHTHTQKFADRTAWYSAY